MTPFGTIMKGTAESTETQSTSGQMSEFEKYLMDQHQKSATKKKTVKKKHSVPLGKSKSSVDLHQEEPVVKKSKLEKSQSADELRKEYHSLSHMTPKQKRMSNRFDEKDKRQYVPNEKDFSNYKQRNRRFKLKHQWTGDPDISDYSEGEEGFDPNDEEWRPDGDDYLDKEEGGPYGNGKFYSVAVTYEKRIFVCFLR